MPSSSSGPHTSFKNPSRAHHLYTNTTETLMVIDYAHRSIMSATDTRQALGADGEYNDDIQVFSQIRECRDSLAGHHRLTDTDSIG